MISLYQYIDNRSNPYKLSKKDKEKLIALDSEYGEIVKLYREEWNPLDVENIEEEMETFLRMKKNGLKYFPKFKLADAPTSDKHGLIPRLQSLRYSFRNFNCVLSNYYIELITDMINTFKYALNPDVRYPSFNQNEDYKPSLIDMEEAYKILKENPYQIQSSKDKRFDGTYAASELQKHIDKFKYPWKVELKDDMVSRVNVDVNGIINVKKTAMFSEADLEGLKVHEIEGHVGRRYYGMKTGLHLFQSGLFGRDILDEGLAIYNSIHKCKLKKPNVEFNMAFKAIISYHKDKLDFNELFDMCRSLSKEIPDEHIFKTLVRFKRELEDTRRKGGGDIPQYYFVGYQMVKDMTDEQRDDILKYNIGPNQIKDLPDIKAFLKANKFKPL